MLAHLPLLPWSHGKIKFYDEGKYYSQGSFKDVSEINGVHELRYTCISLKSEERLTVENFSPEAPRLTSTRMSKQLPTMKSDCVACRVPRPLSSFYLLLASATPYIFFFFLASLPEAEHQQTLVKLKLILSVFLKVGAIVRLPSRSWKQEVHSRSVNQHTRAPSKQNPSQRNGGNMTNSISKRRTMVRRESVCHGRAPQRQRW